MGCFSLVQIEQMLIWVVVIIALVAIIRIVVPWLLSLVGGVDSRISRIIDIILWAVVVIAVIRIVFLPLACLFR